MPLRWQRGDVIALAYSKCRTCHGFGWVRTSHGEHPCNCALRNIFRACLRKYLELRDEAWFYSAGRRWWASIEYLADFLLVSRRHLDDWEWRLFHLHMLEGRPWHQCAGKLGVDRGNFFHAVYRIESRLGRAMRETEPYPLYPFADYFNPPCGRARGVANRAAEGVIHEVFGQCNYPGAGSRSPGHQRDAGGAPTPWPLLGHGRAERRPGPDRSAGALRQS